MKRIIASIVLIAITTLLAFGCTQMSGDPLEQAEEYLRTGQFAKAKMNIDEFIAADSLSPKALYGKALLEEYQSFEWDAILLHIEAARMEGGFVPSMDAFIRLAIELDYLENARRMARIYIDKFPDNPAGHRYMIKIDLLENKLDSARAGLVRMDAVTDNDKDVVLAEAEIDFHSYDAAVIKAAMAKLSQTSFETAEQFSEVAQLYRYLNMGDSAIEYSRKAVDEDDDDIGYRQQLAQYLFDEMRLEEAYQIVTGIISQSEEYGDASLLAAYIKWTQDDQNTAEQHTLQLFKIKRNSPIPNEKHSDFYAYFGENRLAAGEWQAAYTMALNLKYPDDYLKRVYLKMMEGFLEDRDIATALDYLEEGWGLMPETIEMSLIEAEMKSHFEDRADTARMVIDDRIDDNWNDVKWLEMVAKYFTRSRNHEQAEKLYTRLTELPAPKLVYYTKLLDIYKNNLDEAAADALVKRLPFRFANSGLIHAGLYGVYAETGNIEKATFYAEALYNHSSQYMPYILGLSDQYMKQNRHDDARRLFTTFSDKYSNNPDGYYRLARFDFDNGNMDEVPDLLNKSLDINSRYAYSSELMGEYYQSKGMMDSAMVHYEKAIALHWSTPIAYHNVAEHLLNKFEDLDRAAGLGMAAVRYFGKDRRGYILLGNIYSAMGKDKMAKMQYYKCARMFPEDAEAQFLYGRTLTILKENSDAKEYLQKALDLNLASPQKEEARKLLSNL